jgi:4-amino-4-deoxy-L-arabinose transferase-like glycosyltransferase
MPAADVALKSDLRNPSFWSRENAWLAALALLTIVIHLWCGDRFGFHRDELATLEDSRHLAWGYVAYPPVAPFFGHLSLLLFGASLVGFRFFASLACAISMLVIGLIAREMGGGRRVQLTAAAASAAFVLVAGSLMQYVSFDYLLWTLVAYFVTRLLRSEDPRWWLAIGAAIGFGMLTKYTMGVFAVSVAVGVVLTDSRQYLRSKWLWFGVALSLLIFLPNAIWQAQHHFVSLDFLNHIHERDVRIGRTKDFLPDQLLLTLFAFPIALAGLWFCFFSPRGKRFRMIGWMYVVALVLLYAAKGRGYYLGGAYPMLYAAGATWGEWKLESVRAAWRRMIEGAVWVGLAANAALVIWFALPIAPIGSEHFRHAVKVNGDLVEEIGWPELVAEVARIRDSLPPEQRERTGVLAANYGEAGAINLYGPQHKLPRAMSGVNSFYYQGYLEPPPQTVIALGFSQSFLDRNFEGCRIAGHTPNPYNVENEETRDHPDIYMCGAPKRGWEEFWKGFQRFG